MSINWEAVVRQHASFVTSNEHPEVGVCLRDGCGTACFYGRTAWLEAAQFLGFTDIVLDYPWYIVATDGEVLARCATEDDAWTRQEHIDPLANVIHESRMQGKVA